MQCVMQNEQMGARSAMEDSRLLRIARGGMLLCAAALGVLGVAAAWLPVFPMAVFCEVTGGILMVFGWVRILGYLSKDLYRLAFQHDLAFGILLNVVGGILILRAGAAGHLTGVLLGVSILADALLKLQTALDARAFGIRRWWGILLTAVFTAAVSGLLLVRPFGAEAPVRLLTGLSLLGEGLLTLITVCFAVRVLKSTRE